MKEKKLTSTEDKGDRAFMDLMLQKFFKSAPSINYERIR